MSDIKITKLQTLTGHRDCVYSLASDGSSVFYSAGGDGMVVRWDLEQGNEGERIAQLPNSIYAIHYWPGENVLITGHNFEGIHLLDLKNKKETGSLKITPSAIFDIQTQGYVAFVACGDGSVVVVNLEKMSIIKKLTFSEKNARTIAINVKSGDVAIGYSDHFIRVFNLADLSLRKEWKAHDGSVFTLVYTADGSGLMSGSRDARFKSWNVKNNYEQDREVVAHMYAINHIAFSPDDKHFVTCSMDKSIKVWQTADLTLLKVIDKARHAGHGTSVNKLLWTSYHNQVISASDDRSISVWDVIF